LKTVSALDHAALGTSLKTSHKLKQENSNITFSHDGIYKMGLRFFNNAIQTAGVL